MNVYRKIMLVALLTAVMATLTPKARAQMLEETMKVTFSGPVELPGEVLPAGSYIFELLDSGHFTRILSEDRTQVYATLATIPRERTEAQAEATVILGDSQKTGLEKVEAWFFPGDSTGSEFVYKSSEKIADKTAAILAQLAALRDAQAEQQAHIDAVGMLAMEGLASANRAATAAKTADQMAAVADLTAANAGRRAKAAMNQIGAAAEQIENRIANLDKYRVADEAMVNFNFNSDVLTADAMSDLDNNVVSAVSGAHGGYLIELQGFTDNIGTEKYNLNLSDRRVESVLRYLVSNGVPLSRISLVGLGKADPVADNQFPAGREQNRRVEIRVLRSSETTTAAR
jgi:outer membrane protein OmpA-like peptidoglycan-associated protein